MPLCERCQQEIEPDFNERGKDFLPPNVEFYDFGGGTMIMPVPDIAGSGTYLTQHIAALCGRKDGGLLADAIKDQAEILMLAFEVPPRMKRTIREWNDAVLDQARLAVKAWPRKCSIVGEGSRFTIVRPNELEEAI